MSEFKITMEAARVNAGLTQQAIADKMAVSRQTIHFWEKGKVIPKPAEFKMYCDICNAPVDIIILPTA